MEKIIRLLKTIVWELSLKLCSSFFIFCKKKVTFNENISFTGSASWIWLPDGLKVAMNWKSDNEFTIRWHYVIVKLFWRCFISFVKFSYWCKFQDNVITGSGIMIIFFYQGLTRNLENKIASSEFCTISGNRGELEIPNLERMFLIKRY